MKRRESRAVWVARVRAWRKSGATRKEFCERNGLVPHQLSWWKWQLSKRRGESLRGVREAPAEKRPSKNGSSGSAAKFLEAHLVAPAPSGGGQVIGTHWCDGAVEIVVGDARIIRVRSGFDSAVLRQVLSVLEERK